MATSKQAVPSLNAFHAPVLNSKIKTLCKKIHDYGDLYNPQADSKPMDLSSTQLLPSSAEDGPDDDARPPTTQLVLCSFPGTPQSLPSGAPGMPDGCCVSGLATGSVKRAKVESPPKSELADSMVYTKQVVKASPTQSTLRLHELMHFKDEKTGLHHVQIFLKILTDHDMLQHVSADRKSLPLSSTTTMTLDHNDPGTEEFMYTITLPKAVDSNCISKRFVYRAIDTTDLSGRCVTIMQAVARVLVYMVLGQCSGDQQVVEVFGSFKSVYRKLIEIDKKTKAAHKSMKEVEAQVMVEKEEKAVKAKKQNK
ncbi:hypothetical protein HDU77_004326 [Chytriomyces hyalinus]|nr:hypothetical protein HDU77_004326 [Chytriomyces hyalinus]